LYQCKEVGGVVETGGWAGDSGSWGKTQEILGVGVKIGKKPERNVGITSWLYWNLYPVRKNEAGKSWGGAGVVNLWKKKLKA